MLECPGCERRQRLMQQLGTMFDVEHNRREAVEERFTRLKHLVVKCQCLKRFLKENPFETIA